MSVVIVNVFGFMRYQFQLNWIGNDDHEDDANENQNAPHGISV